MPPASISRRTVLAVLSPMLPERSACGDTGTQSRQMFRAGLRLAPLFHAFVRFVIAEAEHRAIDRIFYFTREGEFFRAIHVEIARTRPRLSPRADLLEVSRRSTFAASLEEVTPRALMRLWTLYSTQTPRGLLSSLNVDPASFDADVRRHHLTLDTSVQHPWADPRIVAFLEDESVAARLEASRHRQRDALLSYCESRGFGQGPAAIVDIGWRGTIHDNLARLLPQATIHGTYLGLLSFLNDQPANVTKTAFGPDDNQSGCDVSDLLRYVTPYEMLTNSPNGSVTGYTRTSGSVIASREISPGEDSVYRRFTQPFQQGVLSAIGELERMAWARHQSDEWLRDRALRLWRQLAFDPPAALARAYMALTHDETFGLGAHVNKEQPRPARLLWSAIVDRQRRVEFEQWLERSSWPAGVVAAHNLRLPSLLALRRRTMEPPPGQFDRVLLESRGRRRWRRLAREFAGAKVCCYGAGAFAAAVVRHRDFSGLNFAAFIDRDPKKIGRQIGPYPIVGPDSLAALQPDVLLVAVFRNPAVVDSVKALVSAAGLRCHVRADVWE